MRLIILILCLLQCAVVSANEPAMRFERLTIENGLSQNSVYSILQDRSGFLWFGSQDGLNRYDGYQFKHFRHDEQDPNSISDNTANAIFEDANGDLWIGTNRGVNRYDKQTQRFVGFSHSDSDANSLSHNVVTAIGEDGQGRLWVGTLGGGLNRFDESTEQFVHYQHQSGDGSLSEDKIRAIYKDSGGMLWIGTLGGGLNYYDAKTDRFAVFKHRPDDPNSLSHDSVYSLFEDAKGVLWVGTGGGLNRFDARTKRFERFVHQPLKSNSLSHNNIHSITQDQRGLLWIGTFGGGLDLFDPQSGHFLHYRNQPSVPYSLSHNIVRSLYQDGKGLMWVGTQGGGVNKVDTRQSQFGHIMHQASSANSLAHGSIRAIFQDTNDTLWIGSRGGGLSKSRGENLGFERFIHQEANPDSLGHNTVMSVIEAAKGGLWVGTFGGLDKYDPTTGLFKHFRRDQADVSSLSHDWVRTLFEDSKGTLWVGTRGGGLNQFDGGQQNFKHFRFNASDSGSLSSDYVNAILEDAHGFLWIGTNGGLNLFDQDSGLFTRFEYDEQDPGSLSHDHVTSIFQDSNDILWVGTYGGGLNKYNPKTRRFTHYRGKDGLPNEAVYGILEDKSGQLWLSTNLGLSMFDPWTHTFKNYDVHDGLQSNEFNGGAFFQNSLGEMFFGGINGVNRFNPGTIRDDKQPPVVVFTDFLAFNQSVDVQPEPVLGDERFVLPKAINQLSQLKLGYQQSLVSFEFAALDYRNPEKNRYRYKLEGWDKNWITADAKIRRATYTNLPSGDYTLRVKASNPDGYWNELGTSIAIVVASPPWLSWWAYTLYGLLFAAALFAFEYVRIERSKILNERTLINRLRQVDKLKDAFLANTSHELRTPLNGIIGLAESLMDGATGSLPVKTNENLAMVVASGKRLASLINDILDLSKLKHSGIVLRPQPIDLHALADVVLTLSEPLIVDKSLSLVNAVPTGLPMVEADEDRLMQIMHNLVGNGIKFSFTGTVTVSAQIIDQQVKISVADTGIGISEDKFATIFEAFEQAQTDSERDYGGTGLGLSITRQLVALHGGSIEVTSELGLGSTFAFVLPLNGANLSTDTGAIPSVIASPFYTQDDEGQNANADVVFDLRQSDFDGSGFKLLLVDDEPINLHVLKNHLSVHHYQLFEASDGLAALRAIEEDGPFDLVLLDIMMPKLSGYEVCKTIRQTYTVSDLPVIFLTAQNQVNDLVQGFAVGANDHLTKPVAKHELLSRVKTHLKLLDINRNLQNRVNEQTHDILSSQKKQILARKLTLLAKLMANAKVDLDNPENFVQVCVQNLEADLAKCQEFIFELAEEHTDEQMLEDFRCQLSPFYVHLQMIKQQLGVDKG